MNVAYVLHQTTSVGGGSKSFMQMLKGLMQKGVHPYVIMPDRQDLFYDIERMDISTFVVTFKNATYPDVPTLKDIFLFLPRLFARILINWKAAKAIANYLSDKQIDLIYTNVSVCDVGFRAAHIMNIPHIYHVREYGDIDFHYHYFPSRRVFLKRLHSLGSYSVFITKDIHRHFNQENNPSSRVIYNGIQPKADTMPTAECGNYFLYAGKVTQPKGLYELLTAYQAYQAATSAPLPLWVAGDTDETRYYNKVCRYVESCGMTDNVRFLGARKDISQLMRQARAIIVPSLYEAFGRCMPEAMFNGCLCLGHNTGGTKEQLDNGVQLSGEEIALRYDTEDELAALLSQVSRSNPADYLPMRERAFKVVNSLYSSEAHVNRMFKFYQTILQA